MTIPIARPYLGIEEEDAAVRAVRSGWITQGPIVRAFEIQFAEYVGAEHAIAVSSCTTGLHALLLAVGVKPGDEVILPSLSFIATANVVCHCGGKPVFAEIDPRTCNIDPDKIEQLISPRTKVLMPVHQMGLAADLDRLKSIADRYNLSLIEDAACAIGSTYKGKNVGGHGNHACFSFHPRKVITTGEGGMITTNDSALAQHLRRLRHHGMTISDLDRHESPGVLVEGYSEVGYNYRLSDIQAAIGIEQLKKLPEILTRRRRIAHVYDQRLQDIPGIGSLQVPSYATTNYQSYWILVSHDHGQSRDAISAAMFQQEIHARRGIMAIHEELAYKPFLVSLPLTEQVTQEMLLLPLYPDMTVDDANHVVDTFLEILR